MHKYGSSNPPPRTYGKTSVGWGNKSRNLWAEMEADEEVRRQKEKERLEAEEKKILEEEEERRRRKKEKKKERKRKEMEERSAAEPQSTEREDEAEVLAEGVSKLNFRGDFEEDEVQRQIEAEAAATLLDASTETPLTSPEKNKEKIEGSEQSAIPSTLLLQKQFRKASLIFTSPLLPYPLIPQNVSPIAIETIPPTPGAPPPLPIEDDSSEATIGNNQDHDGKVEEMRLRSPGPRPTTPLLTPDRRGGLRRKSSRLTISPGSRSISPIAGVSNLQRSSVTQAGGASAEEVKYKGLVQKHKERLSTSTLISVAVTPVKLKVGVAVGEYEVYSDHEEERNAPQPTPRPEETHELNDDDDDDEVDDWSEWGKSTVSEAELSELLSLCTVNEVIDFNGHIQSILKSSTLSKLGEASYSEVFLQTPHTQSSPIPPKTVLKIIPFGNATQCPLKQILDELVITKTMAPTPGFIGFHSAHIVRGEFPQHLMDLWDHWDQHVKPGGSENDRPNFYKEDQLLAVIGLEDGGRDLEGWSFKGEVEGEGGWREAREVFWRVAGALARGEAEREFEHRDLHFGNIVIKRVPVRESDGNSPDKMFANLSLNDGGGVKRGKSKSLKKEQKSGPAARQTRLQVSLIDYTLSRARCEKGLLSFTPLDDEALFLGKGDYQFDIYRFMRAHLITITNPPLDPSTGEPNLDWSVYVPASNLYWLHYLLHILLHKKHSLRKPPGQSTSSRSKSLFAEEDVLAYRELEGLYKFLDCRPRGSKRGAPVVEEKSTWGGLEEGAWGFVEWALSEGMVGKEDL